MNPAPRAVEDILIPVQDIQLSGLLALAHGEPRATIVALHGGGMRANYFHGQQHPDLSLLTLGAALGYNVLALDRPGYGASQGLAFERGRIVNQADMIFAAMDAFARDHEVGAGFFIASHSFGMKVAIAMTAHPRGAELLGIEATGAGLRYDPEQLYLFEDMESPRPKGLERSLFWGPEWLYPEGTFAPGVRPVADVPDIEKEESLRWPELLPQFAAKTAVPLHLTIADHERWWDFGDDAKNTLRSLFANSPRFEISVHAHAGHNISLGKSARAYHLKTLAFAEECIVGRAIATQLDR